MLDSKDVAGFSTDQHLAVISYTLRSMPTYPFAQSLSPTCQQQLPAR